MVQVHKREKVKVLIILVLLLFLAAILDFYRGKIPNILVFIGCCYGMIRLLYYQDMIYHIPGVLFPVIILFPLYKIGVIGAGDIKLFSMLGFYFTFMETIFCIFMTFVLGAVVSIIFFMRYENFLERMTYLFSYLKECLSLGHFQCYYSASKGKQISNQKEDQSKIHLAIPIFISVLLQVGGVL